MCRDISSLLLVYISFIFQGQFYMLAVTLEKEPLAVLEIAAPGVNSVLKYSDPGAKDGFSL